MTTFKHSAIWTLNINPPLAVRLVTADHRKTANLVYKKMASSRKEKKNWIPSPAQLPQHLFLSIFQAGLESHSVTDNINYCIQLMNWETATYSWCVHFILPHFWKPLICRLQKENKQAWFNKTDNFLISEITADWIIYQEKTKGFFFLNIYLTS